MMTDPFNLQRFADAQANCYETALAEIRNGAKNSHWMWFIFPQLDGLGRSAMAKHFGIRSIEEASAYLRHPLLGSRFRECVAAFQRLKNTSAETVFGSVDAQKLRSSLTLFEAAGNDALFAAALDRWFDARDMATLNLLRDTTPSRSA